jgi:hypothetical protein
VGVQAQGLQVDRTGEADWRWGDWEGEFGASVALAADGKTALIGGPRDNEYAGAAWVFKRSGLTWTQQGEKLTGGEEITELCCGIRPGVSFGNSVALSSDGDTALIGGPGDNPAYIYAYGAAWVFTRSGSTWTQQGSKLKAHGEVDEGPNFVGSRVALSGDGNTALLGGQECHHCGGAIWVFTRSGSTWTQQRQELLGPSPLSDLRDIALSSDGNTALMGTSGNFHDGYLGEALIFTRSGTTWTQQGPTITNGTTYFATTAGLSSDGDTALIGELAGQFGELSGAFVFTRSASTWTQRFPPLICARATCGRGAALSGDGRTALIGTTVFVNWPHK